MRKTILVVDDSFVNRRILRKILGSVYAVEEAENGREAIAILHRQHLLLSAVLLDIVMPDVDGYAVLEHMRSNPVLAQIPVVVASACTDRDSERKALAMGANDYVTIPYDADILLKRLYNLIKLRESSSMLNMLQKDRLTGLWNRETFFEKAAWNIARQPQGYYVLVCIDIDNFKVINDQYGMAKGDEVLKNIAAALRKSCTMEGSLCGRISGDDFIALYPRRSLPVDATEPWELDTQFADGIAMVVTASVGRYIVDDKTLSVSAMYDRAKIAQAMVKGRYDVHMAVYNEAMRSQMLRRQEIISEMNTALDAGQFEVWFQPQYNHSTGALIGAEALARWRHPRHGVVPPGEFIAIFERNGFIYELDKFIWDRVCWYLSKWIDEGRSPLPVAVNISRYDLFREDLVDTLVGLTRKYNVPPDLMRLEITESAFTRSIRQIVEMVKLLIERGFTVEIDDFGSGYSSLNTLKDISAQIVKLDMRFLENGGHTDRGGNILESIVRMTKWLGMSVIAEGVEETAQADFLKSIGCNYVQGFLYAMPMPPSEYEQLAKGVAKEEKLLALETVENIENSEFWDPQSVDTLLFNNYLGGACIFEWHEERIELLRANEKYAKLIGGEHVTIQDALGVVWVDHMDDETCRATREAIGRAITTCDDVTYEARYSGMFGREDDIWLRMTLRVVARAANRYLICALCDNITARKRAEAEADRLRTCLQAALDSVAEGVCVLGTEPLNWQPVCANDAFFAFFGYTRDQFAAELSNGLADLLPPDRLTEALATAEPLRECLLTARCRDGRDLPARLTISSRDIGGARELLCMVSCDASFRANNGCAAAL